MSTKPILTGYLIQHEYALTLVIDKTLRCWEPGQWNWRGGIKPFATREEAEAALVRWNASSTPGSHGTIIDVADAPFEVSVVVAYRDLERVEAAVRDLLWKDPTCPSTSKP